MSSDARQYATAFAATLGAFSMGGILGYTSSVSLQLQAKGPFNCSTLQNAPLSDDEVSWFNSSQNLTAIIGSLVTGVLMDRVGRRNTMLLSSVPFIIAWVLIGTAGTYAQLLTGRLVSGLCIGLIIMVVPTFLGEIASPAIRGRLGGCFQLMVNIGILYTYSAGAYLCWRWLSLAAAIPVFFYFGGVFLSADSPSYVLNKMGPKEAKKTLTKLRGDDHDIDEELNILQHAMATPKTKRAAFLELFLPHNLKPLMIASTLLIFQQWSGFFAAIFNLDYIFESSGSSLSSSTSSIIVAAVNVVGTAFASAMLDKVGRKPLLMISAFVMASAHAAMGTYFYLKERGYDVAPVYWLPLVAVVVFVGAFSVGYGPVPWVVFGEIFNDDIREAAGMIATTINSFSCFLVAVIFVPLQKEIQNSGVYWMFCCICVMNLLFSTIVVKETKGKTRLEIAEMFGQSKSLK